MKLEHTPMPVRFSEWLAGVRRFINQMAPHHRARDGGRLLVEAVQEIERMNNIQQQLAELRSGYYSNLHCERIFLESYDRKGRDSCLQTAMFHRAQARAKLVLIRSLEEQEGEAK